MTRETKCGIALLIAMFFAAGIMNTLELAYF